MSFQFSSSEVRFRFLLCSFFSCAASNPSTSKPSTRSHTPSGRLRWLRTSSSASNVSPQRGQNGLP